MATIKDVARLAGVSGATVSHVINKTRKVNPETVEKVEKAIFDLDFRPNSQARGLKTGVSHLVGVINYSYVDPYFSEVLQGIGQAADIHHYGVVLRYSELCENNQQYNLRVLMDKNIDGLIVNSPIVTEEFYETISKFGGPCVFLQFYDPNLSVDYIHTDDYQAGFEATRYLMGLNHQKIACIAGLTYPEHTASLRKNGYEDALRSAGLPVRADYFVTSNYSIGEGYEIFKQLRALPDPPTAVMTYSDLLAFGALRAAADLGLSVPQDVSIMGFDNIEMAEFTVPRLTTVSQERAQLGRLAFEQIYKRIQNPQLKPERCILGTQIAVRESCGPLKTL